MLWSALRSLHLDAGYASMSGALFPNGATRQVWRYEGARTLAAYLRRRDCVSALARDLGVPADAAAATVLRQILESLAARPHPLDFTPPRPARCQLGISRAEPSITVPKVRRAAIAMLRASRRTAHTDASQQTK